ncbi:hypothetical protein NUW54_g2172 [Trametes sanguinea]|uniref:Uncharacterized protein n=1 Tax=Trametes sanguinea TaxID=158606 RepID=A0ACC1Q631_9APHY|nr:hypothetical protein NUW54_g2172 [Trametes sanguinea]
MPSGRLPPCRFEASFLAAVPRNRLPVTLPAVSLGAAEVEVNINMEDGTVVFEAVAEELWRLRAILTLTMAEGNGSSVFGDAPETVEAFTLDTDIDADLTEEGCIDNNDDGCCPLDAL